MFIRVLAVILCGLFWGCGNNDKYGTTIDAVGIYQRDGRPILNENNTVQTVIVKGIRVKLIEPNGCQAKDSEKMVVVMTPNQAQDFVKGYTACVPERKIKWD